MDKNTIVGGFFVEHSIDEAIRSAKPLNKERTIAVMEAVLQDVDVKNRNGRIYRRQAIQGAIDGPYIQEKLRTKSLLGEANHPPDTASLARRNQIDITNVSHVVKKLWWEGNLLIGTVETAATKVGKDFAGLILENGMNASFSMRGSGNFIKKQDYVDVVGPLDIKAWDAVQYPSHASAYSRNLIENVSYTTNITLGELTQYIAEQADKDGCIMESVFNVGRDMVDFVYEDGNLIVIEKKSNKALGWHSLNEELSNEFNHHMKSLLG